MMNVLMKFAAALCAIGTVTAQTDEQKKQYKKFHVSNTPYAWEPYKLKTEDGWHLTIFRITGPKDAPNYENPEHKDKSPILLHRLSAEGKL